MVDLEELEREIKVLEVGLIYMGRCSHEFSDDPKKIAQCNLETANYINRVFKNILPYLYESFPPRIIEERMEHDIEIDIWKKIRME